jgi:hypothetical protein
MVMDLKVVGYSRNGKIECLDCAQKHQEEIDQERKQKLTDRVYRGEAAHLNCDNCGTCLGT